MKKLFLITLIPVLLLIAGIIFGINYPKSEIKTLKPFSQGTGDNPNARKEFEFKKTRDISTNRIPENIRNLEQQFASKLPKVTDIDNPSSLVWNERGPNNVGGRTRALAGDIANPNTIIAGGISGGMWRSTNSGASWIKTTNNIQLHSATCIAQDKRPGSTSNWYVGTGERTGNSAGLFLGNGIYKSTDNGLNWNLLPSTSGIPPSSFTSSWQYVWNVATDQSNASQEEVYAATIGILYKSVNGGANWTQVIGDLTNMSEFTDVAVTTDGVVYASGSFVAGGQLSGIKRSTDGENFVNITPPSFPPSFGRVVLELAPSNQNVLYVAVHGVPPGTPGAVNNHMFWKYTYVSGNGTGSGGIWENRSSNLPQLNQNNYGNFNEPFDTQGGYDLDITVKPDNENFVVLGAVNLYVSSDGFATINNAKRIGGYQPGTENGTYPNHHPDVHSGYFKPGNNNQYISGHDGGLSFTADITTNLSQNNPVTWQSLNNGYNVTQFYAVSIAPDAGSGRIAGGFQDNGSYSSNSVTLTNPWSDVNSGDGGFCMVAPIADNRIYSSSQNGEITRTALDGSEYVGMKPAGSTNPQFINPQIIDRNNSSLIYFGGGNSPSTTGIWRNNNAINATTTVGWTYLAGSDFGSASAKVSTISVSKANSSNVLYYGSDEGHIRKITNANSGGYTVSGDLNTGLPNGFVSCIAIDPENSDKVLAVFSNYNIGSLWYSSNGGNTWTNVEGNLGGVNGPSVRWAEIFYVQSVMHIVLATSTGVYYTQTLNGAGTVWTQEAVTSIGNVVCVHAEFRDVDKTLVIGTHGRGAFQTQVLTPISVQPISSEVPKGFSLSQNYPNPFNPSTNIKFDISKNSYVTLKVYDMLGKEVASLVNENLSAGSYNAVWNASSFTSGIYFYKIKAGSYTEVRKMTLVK